APATISIQSTASDQDGSVTRVDILTNNVLLATLTSSPFNFNWTNVAAGTYSLTAKATDNVGNTNLSSPVSIIVNALPSVSITNPANGAFTPPPTNITIGVSASDSDGSISRVDFYQGTNLLGSKSVSPFTMVWSNVTKGSYTLTAKAVDNRNA